MLIELQISAYESEWFRRLGRPSEVWWGFPKVLFTSIHDLRSSHKSSYGCEPSIRLNVYILIDKAFHIPSSQNSTSAMKTRAY
jgi:hypothetical protein